MIGRCTRIDMPYIDVKSFRNPCYAKQSGAMAPSAQL
jgi:hypothetical protein